MEDDNFVGNKNRMAKISPPKIPYSLSTINLLKKLIVNKALACAQLTLVRSQFNGLCNLVRERLSFIKLDGEPDYASDSIALNLRILKEFVRECKRQKSDRSCYILRLPYIVDFATENLKILDSIRSDKELKKHLINLKDECLFSSYSAKGINSLDEIRSQLSPDKHYNAITSEVIAECVFHEISDNLKNKP